MPEVALTNVRATVNLTFVGRKYTPCNFAYASNKRNLLTFIIKLHHLKPYVIKYPAMIFDPRPLESKLIIDKCCAG